MIHLFDRDFDAFHNILWLQEPLGNRRHNRVLSKRLSECCFGAYGFFQDGFRDVAETDQKRSYPIEPRWGQGMMGAHREGRYRLDSSRVKPTPSLHDAASRELEHELHMGIGVVQAWNVDEVLPAFHDTAIDAEAPELLLDIYMCL